MTEEVGYRSLRKLFDKLESTQGIKIHGDNSLFERIQVPEGSVEKIFPVAVGGTISKLFGLVGVQEGVEIGNGKEWPGWKVMLTGTKKPGLLKDYHCDVRFTKYEDTGTIDIDYTLESWELFNFQQDDQNVPEQGSLLLRFQCGEKHVLFPLKDMIAEISPPHNALLDGLIYCGIPLGKWNFLTSDKTEKERKPTDIVLEFSYVKIGDVFYSLALAHAHRSRPQTVFDICKKIGFSVDTKDYPVHFFYSPRFNRKTLIDYGINVPSDNSNYKIPEDWPPEDSPKEDSSKGSKILSIIDILGEYRPKERQCVLFPRMISLAAHSLSVKVNALEKVVEVHELAHAITHAGCDLDGNIWNKHHISDYELHENLAQALTFTFPLVQNNSDIKDAFEKLNEHQPSEYRDFHKLSSMTNEEFRAYLMERRL